MINCFNKEKIVSIKSINKKEMTYLIPEYKYKKGINNLIIKTDFIDLDYNPSKCSKKDELKVKGIGKYLNQYHKKMDKYMKKLKIKNISKEIDEENEFIDNNLLSSESVEFLRFRWNRNLIRTKIINHNVSRYYPRIEKFDKISMKELQRILGTGKSIKFVLKPISWINCKEKIGGNYFQILEMEIKYCSTNIKSLIDSREKETVDTIKI